MLLKDFTNLELSSKNYSSGIMSKYGVLIDGERYLLKLQDLTKYPIFENDYRHFYSTYASHVFSEYIGCNFIRFVAQHYNNLYKKSPPFDVQTVQLGITIDQNSNNERIHSPSYIPAVACKDFCNAETFDELITFGSIVERLNRSEHRSFKNKLSGSLLDDVLYVIEHQKFIPVEQLTDFFWAQFILDSFIGNFDRNPDNWGIIWNKVDNLYKIAPIFDCGSSFHPKTPRGIIEDYNASDEQLVFEKAILMPTSHFSFMMNNSSFNSYKNKPKRVRYCDFYQILNAASAANSNLIPFTNIQHIKHIQRIFSELKPVMLNAISDTFSLMEVMLKQDILTKDRHDLLVKEMNMKVKLFFNHPDKLFSYLKQQKSKQSKTMANKHNLNLVIKR